MNNEIFETAFISGHLDLTQEEFNDHYKPLIQKAIDLKHNIIVGDAKGADKMSQEFLKDMNYSIVILFHMFEKPRNLIGLFATVGGFESDEERDSEMTKYSTYDIAWVRPGREKSGTAKNLKRRNNG